MQMIPYRLPLKFILLWVVNLAVLLILSFTTDLGDVIFRLPVRDLTWIYLLAGGILAGLEQALLDKLKENLFPKDE